MCVIPLVDMDCVLVNIPLCRVTAFIQSLCVIRTIRLNGINFRNKSSRSTQGYCILTFLARHGRGGRDNGDGGVAKMAFSTSDRV